MSGYQFLHFETYSRKPDKHGCYIEQILAEAERDPAFSAHVADPQPAFMTGGEIKPGVPFSVPRLRAAHDEMVQDAVVEVRRKGKVHKRKVREDRPTLATAVASWPVPCADVLADPGKLADVKEWISRSEAFLKDLWGDQFKGFVVHADEAYIHMHAYALPDDRKDVDANAALHPGHALKREAEKKAKARGFGKSVAVTLGNKAYRRAMRKVQDAYYLKVGEPCGLTRQGPRRQRLSRAGWQQAKHEAELKKASHLEARSAALKDAEARQAAREEQIRQEVQLLEQAQADQIESVRLIEDAKRDCQERERALDRREAELAKLEGRIPALKNERDALTRAITALEDVKTHVRADALRDVEELGRIDAKAVTARAELEGILQEKDAARQAAQEQADGMIATANQEAAGIVKRTKATASRYEEGFEALARSMEDGSLHIDKTGRPEGSRPGMFADAPSSVLRVARRLAGVVSRHRSAQHAVEKELRAAKEARARYEHRCELQAIMFDTALKHARMITEALERVADPGIRELLSGLHDGLAPMITADQSELAEMAFDPLG